MSLRNRKSLMIAIAVLALTCAGLVLLYRARPASPAQAYYFDMDTGEVFTAAAAELPIEAPSGGRGVSAVVVSCSACEPGQWRVVSIHSFTPEALELLQRPEPDPADDAAYNQWNRARSQGAHHRPAT